MKRLINNISAFKYWSWKEEFINKQKLQVAETMGNVKSCLSRYCCCCCNNDKSKLRRRSENIELNPMARALVDDHRGNIRSSDEEGVDEVGELYLSINRWLTSRWEWIAVHLIANISVRIVNICSQTQIFPRRWTHRITDMKGQHFWWRSIDLVVERLTWEFYSGEFCVYGNFKFMKCWILSVWSYE